jgi:hypothetical protein
MWEEASWSAQRMCSPLSLTQRGLRLPAFFFNFSIYLSFSSFPPLFLGVMICAEHVLPERPTIETKETYYRGKREAQSTCSPRDLL